MTVIDLDPNAHKRDVPAIFATFYTEEVEDEAETVKAGHVVYKTIDKVEWGRKGQNRVVLNDKIARIRKNADIWAVMEPAYLAWKKGQEAPLTGTPLKMWPAIKPAQIRTLQNVGIRTVEELELLSDTDADRIGMMEARHLRARARAWKAAANDIGKFAERLAAIEAADSQKDARIAELERANAELHGALQRTGTVQAPAIPEPQKKRA